MAFVRGDASGYVHSQAITSGVAFPACDAILVTAAGSPTITLKTGSQVTLTTVAVNTILPLAAITVTDAGAGTYVALYR